MHGNNYPGLNTDDLDAWQRINPGLVVLCQPDLNLIPEIRRRIPGVVIVARVFGDYAGGWDAWHLPWTDQERMAAYGRYVARLANQFDPDIIQYANEPGIDDNDPSWWTVAGYQKLGRGCGWVVDGYRQAGGRARLGTVPLSPGHEEDDGLLGAQFLREVWHRHDVLLLHTYWNRDPASVESEWYGRRYQRQLVAYEWFNRHYAITEWNRDETGQFGDAERMSFADDARRWIAGLSPEWLLGTAEYIWWTGDEANFGKLRMRENRWLIDVAAEVNAAQEEPMGLTDTKLTLASEPTLYADHDNIVVIQASGVDKGIFTCIVNGDPAPDDSASMPATSFFGVLGDHAPDATQQRLVNGRNLLHIPVGKARIPGPFGATLRISIAESDGQAFESGDRIDERVTIQTVQTPAGPGAPDALLPEYDPLFALAGALQDKGNAQDKDIGLRIHKLIQWRKGELDADPFPKARR